MWRLKLSSDKILAYFRKFFVGEYHDLFKLQCIIATQAGLNGANMAIIMQNNISKELDNLVMATTSGKDGLTQLTSTIDHWSET